MKWYLTPNQLSNEQQQLLDKFIGAFLPERGNKRKNSGNELEYVANSLDKVFKKQFGFNLSRRDVLSSFHRLGYNIFTKKGEWDWEKKDLKPSGNGDAIRGGDGYEGFEASFIYIDINPPLVRDLMLTRQTTIPNLNAERQAEIDTLKKKIETFKQQL